ncbi:MAG: hypothetical protein KAU21_02780, partial [Gammaproteobacteria bacterium]|nr:hypothetical protein [Gammaproteobacteria bacterium]
AEPQNLVGTTIALTAGRPENSGYVTIALNSHESLPGAAVSLKVFRLGTDAVSCNVYQGHIWVVPTDNPFEESLTLRHSGDFAGDPDLVEFNWYYQPDAAGPPDLPGATPVTPWVGPYQSGPGAIDMTIEGPGIVTLSDNWFVARYGGTGAGSGLGNNMCNNDTVPSDWAGDPGSGTSKAMLAQGWIKRVIAALNPFDQRVSNFHENEASTLTSMIAQAGTPYNGAVAVTQDSVADIGLIEAYQSILERGEDLSINAGFNDAAANTQLLNAATRLSDLYMLLGNEAYADAQDPTIGFDTGSEFGSLASSMFSFKNQLDSSMEEELVLLRGRDDAHGGV